MVDNNNWTSSGFGFRPEFIPMNYEISPSTHESSGEASLPTAPISLDQNYVIKNSIFENGASWQFCGAAGPYPDKMVRGGIDSDGSVIYVGRAFHNGDMIPAKIIPDKNMAYVAYGGEEIEKEDFEVLRAGDFVWEFCTGGAVPEGAVTCGQTADGEPLYVGRALYSGTQTPGKVHPSHGCLYIPFDGAEVSIAEYEVLCLK